ncbi:MAG: hypothetical protein IKG97_01515 [Lachnospiraceae bacterium]|nr:hypothetical protein [Lachnospiraceae bacterium]
MMEKIKKWPFLWAGIGMAGLGLVFMILSGITKAGAFKDIGMILMILAIIPFLIALVKAGHTKGDRNRRCKQCNTIPDWETVDYTIKSTRPLKDRNGHLTGCYDHEVVFAWKCPKCQTENNATCIFALNINCPPVNRNELSQSDRAHMDRFVKDFFDPELVINNVISFDGHETSFSKKK